MKSTKALISGAVLLALVAAADLARAETPAISEPPNLPARDYASAVREIRKATFAVIKYYDGSKAVVSDPAWLNPLKDLIAAADGEPADVCFCVTYPLVTFADKDGPIATLEVAHGEKFSIHGGRVSGEFRVSKRFAQLAVDLLVIQEGKATAPNRRTPGQPFKPVTGTPFPAKLQTPAPPKS